MGKILVKNAVKRKAGMLYYVDGQDSGGNDILKIQCFCNSTFCTKYKILSQTISYVHNHITWQRQSLWGNKS